MTLNRILVLLVIIVLISANAKAASVFRPVNELNKLTYGEQLQTLYLDFELTPEVALAKLETIKQKLANTSNPYYVFAIKRIEHSIYLRLGEISQAKQAIKELDVFGEQNDHAWLVAEAKMWQATFAIQTGQLAKGEDLLAQSMTIAKKTQFQHLVGRVLNAKAIAKAIQNKQIEALNLYLAALEVFDMFSSDPYIGKIYSNLSVIYIDLEMWQEVLNYSEKALLFHNQNPFSKAVDFAAVYINRGIAFGGVKDFDLQYKALLRAKDYAERSGSIRYMVNTYSNLSDYYVTHQEVDKAKTIIDKCIPLARENDLKVSLAGCLRAKSALLLQQENQQQALEYALEVNEIVNQLNIPTEVMLTQLLLSQIYHSNQSYKLAYMHLKAYYDEKESIVYSSRNQKIKLLESQFYDQKRSYQISLLSAQNKLQAQKIETKSLQQILVFFTLLIVVMSLVFILLKHRTLLAKFKKTRGEYSKLKQVSSLDALTGLKNRHALNEFLHSLKHSYKVYSVVVLDIDHFKQVNDRFGHDYGDRVLQQIGQCLEEIVRQDDVVFRYGGEEFVLMLQCESNEMTEHLLTRIQCAVSQLVFTHGEVTVSLGVLIPARGEQIAKHWKKAFKLADNALYLAKQNGRNRFEVATHTI